VQHQNVRLRRDDLPFSKGLGAAGLQLLAEPPRAHQALGGERVGHCRDCAEPVSVAR